MDPPSMKVGAGDTMTVGRIGDTFDIRTRA